MSDVTLSEKVTALVDGLPPDMDLRRLTVRVLRRIETVGSQSYALPNGRERHTEATLADEARNFCEEIEDALAYAANAHYISGDPRWTAVPPVLAMLWQLAIDVAMTDERPRPIGPGGFTGEAA
jgi:hypothetical protein